MPLTMEQYQKSLAHEIPRQRFSCTHRPGWRNRQHSGGSFPGGFGVSIPSCILTRCLRGIPRGLTTNTTIQRRNFF